MADKMMRTAGRDKATGLARPITISQDSVLTELSRSKVEVITYSESNRLPGTLSGSFQVRTTGTKVFWIPQALNHDGSVLGVFEQSILFESTLDKPVQFIQLMVGAIPTGGGSISLGDIPLTLPTNPTRVFLTPEKGATTTQEHTQRAIFQVPELRTPVEGFLVYANFNEAPTTGEFTIKVVRRF